LGIKWPRHTFERSDQRFQCPFLLPLRALGLARKQPVLMVFEDAHWVDPTSSA
jgi:hypothetical protein